MEKIGKLTMCILTAVIALVFTGCLSSSESGMTISTQCYIRQTDEGYRSYVSISSYSEIERAFFTTSDSYTNMTKVNPNVWKYEENIDTPNATYSITAIAPNEESAISTVFMNFGNKRLGDFTLEEFEYKGETDVLSAKWNRVDSANCYYLMVCLESNNSFPRYHYNYLEWGTEEVLNCAGSCNLTNTIQYFYGRTLQVGDRIKVAIVAGYMNSGGSVLLLESQDAVITIGTSGNFLDD